MIIMCQCEAETKEALDRLVRGGRYGTASETIAAAIRTLEMLDNASEGKAVFLDEQAGRMARVSSGRRRTAQHTPGIRVADRNVDSIAPHGPRAGVPVVFQLAGLEHKPGVRFAEQPSDAWQIGQRIPVKKWVFGQQNKLLPAKANVRALAKFMLDDSADLRLPQVAARVAEEAADLRSYLQWLDTQQARTRGTALATAFPSNDRGEEKGRVRYAGQFVASLNAKGDVSGLLVALKLINVERVKDDFCIRLTDVGWDFAAKPNPVLDGQMRRDEDRFSDEEVQLLLAHIATSVPAEAYAHFAVLNSIREGNITPRALDDSLRCYDDHTEEAEITRQYLSTQRSGVVSRAYDLALLQRIRSGVKVCYEITDRGNMFLDRLSATMGQ